jgi:L-iditol 2-dehydrogenase
MKAILIKEIGSFDYCDVEMPNPESGEVLVRVKVAGLCRTDLKIIEVGHRDLVLPRIPAEEVVGEVCAIAPDVDSSLMSKNVYIYPGTSCGECEQCLKGAGNLCRGMQIMGFHRDGGFAEYITAPAASVIEIPRGTELEHAVFAEPLSCCLNALEMAQIKTGETIAIWGAGPAGTLLARASEALGAVPTVIEPDERRRALIGGVSSPPDSNFDVCIPAAGSVSAYKEAMSLLGPRGRLVCFSGLAKDEAIQGIDLNTIHYLEQSVVGAYGCSLRHSVAALEMIGSGKVDVDDMISHRLPLSELGHALDLVRQRAGMKILLYPDKEQK